MIVDDFGSSRCLFSGVFGQRRRRTLGFAKKEAEAPPIDDGAQFAKRRRVPHRSTMSPKPRKAKAPTTYKGNDAACRVPLSQISMGPLSGWRKTRPGRLQELRVSFLGGAFEQSTMGDVCFMRSQLNDWFNISSQVGLVAKCRNPPCSAV